MVPKKPDNEISLRVGELTDRSESGRGIVRIDSSSMRELGMREGDIVELKGQRSTGAIAVRAYPADVGLRLVRMDGITRRNVGIGVGETVKIRRAEAKEAKRVVLAPAQKGIMLQIPPEALRGNLLFRPVRKGDMLAPMPVVKQRGQDQFEDIFSSIFGDMGMGGFSPMGELRLMVVSTSPDEITRVGEATEIEVRPEAVEIEEKAVPAITYEDIGGLHGPIEKIREMVELPLRHPELFIKLGIQPPKGVLLYGPPGSGKTLLAKAVANESGASFFLINGPEIMTKWYGGSEENLRNVFQEAEKNAPSIIFIDEIDAIAPKREEVTGEVERRVVSTLLTQMDGLKSRGKVIVIAATNRENSIDTALRRPGRFDREVEIGVPDQKGRLEILKIHTRNMPLTKDVDLSWLSSVTYGFVGADLEALAKEAAMSALRRNLPVISWKKEELPPKVFEKLVVTKEDFGNARKLVEPSAMREVLVEIPKVKWSDVGGLEEVKELLKESVQWPLSNPEAFRRIGIRPPSGILLYGPPGSGKTLLAKAVATESEANFISIKGPEVFSMWVGESLPFDEKIMIVEDGIVKKINISDFPNNGHEIFAPTITDDYRAKNSKTMGLIKHPAPPFVYTIRTETGREVRVTGGHSLFVKENGRFMEVLAQDVIPNKTRIAIPRKIVAQPSVKKISLLKYIKDSDWVFVKNSMKYVKEAINKIGINETARILGVEEKNVYSYMRRANLKVGKFLRLMERAGIKFDEEKIELIARKHTLPAVVKIDKDMAVFLGVWAAEGSYTKYGARLSMSSKEAIKIKPLCQKLFGHVTEYRKGNGTDIYIGSVPLKMLLKDVLGLKDGAKNKHAPDIIFSSPLEVIASFLGGYFTGDGYFGKKILEASTISKDLANDILTLLLYFGIVARCRKKQEWNGSISYRISFMWQDFLRTFRDKIGFFDDEKNQKLERYINSLWQNVDSRSLKHKIDGDVYWDLVVDKKIDSYSYPYVYDITVNPTERFIAGFGCVLVHNSERKVREIFRRARQVAPSIIFFDEIDALAPRRGLEAGARVSENVVSQILTEMSGLEEMHNVVVISATNRPDILDPALLRPGRFDRQILVPAPDIKAREEILKIHTKSMPLKGISVSDLARKTEGCSGADLEALAREAGLNALRKNMQAKEVTKTDFSEALKKVRPSINQKVIEFYEKVTEALSSVKPEKKREEEKETYIG